jgi:Fic family protein
MGIRATNMLNKIMDKKRILDSYRPYEPSVRETIAKIDLLDLAYTDLLLDGSNLTMEGVNHILEGGFAPGGSIGEHSSALYHRELLKAFSDMNFMKTEIDERYLKNIYGILTDNGNPEYRQSNPTIYHLGYTPPQYSDIHDDLRALFLEIFRTDFGEDFILRGVTLHDGIVAIYPFAHHSELVARAVLQYELIQNGLFVVPFGLTEQEYNTITGEAVKTGDHGKFYNAVLKAVDRKLDQLVRIAKETEQ